jgi:hypothetical protein
MHYHVETLGPNGQQEDETVNGFSTSEAAEQQIERQRAADPTWEVETGSRYAVTKPCSRRCKIKGN